MTVEQGYDSKDDLYLAPNFTQAELATDNGVMMFELDFLNCLQVLRNVYDDSMAVTNGCRNPRHNTRVGGHPRSLHLTNNTVHMSKHRPGELVHACAVDIARNMDGLQLARLIRIGLNSKWSFGIADTFIHLDLRTRFTNLPRVLYTY